jgi:hypothetical protein
MDHEPTAAAWRPRARTTTATLHGVRCDFLHVPLIFIMAKVPRAKNVIALAKVAVWIAIPYTALMVAQFRSPQSAWVNCGIGGSLEGAGFSAGIADRFRPPGTFNFITAPRNCILC